MAPEGQIILPNWVFQNLCLSEGQNINCALNTDVPKGRFVKI